MYRKVFVKIFFEKQKFEKNFKSNFGNFFIFEKNAG